MKSLLLSVVALFALATVSRADVTVKISNVHLCCDKCVKSADKAVSSVDGAKAARLTSDRWHRLGHYCAGHCHRSKSGVDALTKAGFFGDTADASIKIDASTGAKGAKVQTLTVQGVHRRCPKCVKAPCMKPSAGVSGVTGDTAMLERRSPSTVTGDFNDADVFAALQKAGLTGKAGQ